MKFTPLPLTGAFLIETEPFIDERGFFTRLICQEEFSAHGLRADFVQASMSHNKQRGTLRGMHFQAEPFAENKLVRVTSGSIFDVIIDVRPESTTYLKPWSGVLSSTSRHQLYIPAGFAHGFQTLEDSVEVCYQMTAPFHSAASRGFLWSDPAFSISWPLANTILSPKDLAAPLFSTSLLM